MENHYYNIGGDNLITINATMSQIIKIGHQGENKAVQVAFDLTPFQAEYQGGYPQLVVRRPGDHSGYPVALIVDGSQAIWIVSASDTEKYGHGQCELQWFVGDTLAKSDKYNVLIYSSIPGDAEPPDVPSKAWFERILSDIGDLSDLDTEAKENLVAAINEARQTGGGGAGGTNDHSKLSNRDAADQHPMKAITGLEAALDGKQPTGNYLTEESDPTVPAWAKETQKPSYTAQEVGADPAGTAAGLVSAHNMAEAAHNDIRLLISGLTDRLNALADSDDTTLAQLSEVVAYIKSNRTLIEAITTSKVSVSDIIDNLTTNASNKPLSAAQGVALKALIDAISIPTQLPNPNALTFTGAATGSYDGSAPLSVEIPGGGSGNNDWELLADVTLTEDVATIAITQTPSGEAFSVRELVIIGTPISDGTNKTVQFAPYATEIKYGVELMSLGEVLSSTDGGTSYLSALIQVLPEVVYSRTQYSLYNSDVGYANKLNASRLRNEANVSFAENGDPITKFAIGVWSGGTAGVFRAGTKMRVYGR